MSRPRVAILCDRDPKLERWWSGTLVAMCRALEAEFGSVDYLVPADQDFAQTFSHRWRYIATRLLKGYYWYQYSVPYARFASRQVQSLVDGKSWDAIIALNGYPAFAYLQTTTPILYVNDSTYQQLDEHYPAMVRNPFPWNRREGHKVERRALARSAAITYPAEWAKASAVADYGVDPGKVVVLPFGANLPEAAIPNADEVASLTGAKAAAVPFRLLTVGTEWERKGGDLTLAMTQELQRRGLNVELTIVGMAPGASPPVIEGVTWVPRLNKNQPDQLAKLCEHYRRSHLFVLPTRAECFGIVYAEASAFGLPSLAPDLCGVPGVVRDQVNGHLLPSKAGASEWADAAERLIRDRKAWSQLAASSRKEYEARLNWKAWTQGIAIMVENLRKKQS